MKAVVWRLTRCGCTVADPFSQHGIPDLVWEWPDAGKVHLWCTTQIRYTNKVSSDNNINFLGVWWCALDHLSYGAALLYTDLMTRTICHDNQYVVCCCQDTRNWWAEASSTMRQCYWTSMPDELEHDGEVELQRLVAYMAVQLSDVMIHHSQKIEALATIFTVTMTDAWKKVQPLWKSLLLEYYFVENHTSQSQQMICWVRTPICNWIELICLCLSPTSNKCYHIA